MFSVCTFLTCMTRTVLPRQVYVLLCIAEKAKPALWCPQVMKVLLRHHGANLSGVKSNLYTAIGARRVSHVPRGTAPYSPAVPAGLDSKHASGIQSTVGDHFPLCHLARRC